jgi:glutaredoxin
VRFTVIVYGTRDCRDTRRSLRLLRRLGIAHSFRDLNRDASALARALELTHGRRATPAIEVGTETLIAPSNDGLTHALMRQQAVDATTVEERMNVQNVGDLERALRIGAGVVGLVIAPRTPWLLKWPARIAALSVIATGIAGWCPHYAEAGKTSLGGPGDRPDESERTEWIARRDQFPTVQKEQPSKRS